MSFMLRFSRRMCFSQGVARANPSHHLTSFVLSAPLLKEAGGQSSPLRRKWRACLLLLLGCGRPLVGVRRHPWAARMTVEIGVGVASPGILGDSCTAMTVCVGGGGQSWRAMVAVLLMVMVATTTSGMRRCVWAKHLLLWQSCILVVCSLWP